MFHGRIDPCRAMPLPAPAGPAPGLAPGPAAGPASARRHRGRTGWQSGAAAEDAVARHYSALGARVRHRRLRLPEGELDLVVDQDGQTVFVEVKRCRPGAEPPVTERQWQRLANAALHYILRVQNETGAQPVCRFDLALAGPDGQIRIIENARGFDEH